VDLDAVHYCTEQRPSLWRSSLPSLVPTRYCATIADLWTCCTLQGRRLKQLSFNGYLLCLSRLSLLASSVDPNTWTPCRTRSGPIGFFGDCIRTMELVKCLDSCPPLSVQCFLHGVQKDHTLGSDGFAFPKPAPDPHQAYDLIGLSWP
jgi:hypothetical protein